MDLVFNVSVAITGDISISPSFSYSFLGTEPSTMPSEVPSFLCASFSLLLNTLLLAPDSSALKLKAFVWIH